MAKLYKENKTGKVFKLLLGGVECVENGIHYRGSKKVLLENVNTKALKEMMTKTFVKNFTAITE